MSDPEKVADQLRHAAEKLDKAQVHLRDASRNTSPGDIDEVIVKTGRTVTDLKELLREMALYAELSGKADEIMEENDD
jgi:predicted RNA-binding protein YlqC (UPF0109 family)